MPWFSTSSSTSADPLLAWSAKGGHHAGKQHFFYITDIVNKWGMKITITRAGTWSIANHTHTCTLICISKHCSRNTLVMCIRACRTYPIELVYGNCPAGMCPPGCTLNACPTRYIMVNVVHMRVHVTWLICKQAGHFHSKLDRGIK
jgi:hypothetical protein